MLIAHCDGGSRGNPGPAGYGAVIEDQNGRVLARLSEYLGKRTNNYAEYSALLGVLAWAIENKRPRLRVIADSELMVKQMQGKYKVNSPDLRPLWEEARRRVAKLERFEIAHTLRGGNKEADQLANDAMDRGMGRTPSAPSANPSAPPAHRSPGAASAEKPSPTQQVREASPPARQVLREAGLPARQVLREAGLPARQVSGRQVLEGFVKNGVVHILEGELPDGIFVKIIRE
jgi:probable phosphoglycerate mutase